MQPDPSQLPALKSDPDLSKEFLAYPGGQTYNLSFSLTKAPFEDKKVREAFSEAIDRKTYCEQIRTDCNPALSWIPKGIQGAIETDKYGFDSEKAKQALAASTYGSADKLPEIKLTYNADDPAAQPRIEWLAGQFRDILGVNVTIDPVEGKTLTALRKDPATFPQMLAFGGWIQDYPDPQNWLSVYWTCGSTFAKRVSYCNKQFDELTQKGDVELDPDKRTQYYQQAGEILVEDIPGPFVYNRTNTFLVKPYVQGLIPTTADSSTGWPGQWASQTTVDVVK
jgi:oligopeptide transport system substrate-binding protein